ncbi:MAG: hypothetical protein SGJ23_02535 [Alphaproteobacteria bacterium]|nr:hypothetical protein [Alphaproteobacteria bacterium]
MRLLLTVIAAVLALGACKPATKTASAHGGACGRVVERAATVTGPGDVIEARAIGADCPNAIVVWTLRTSTGKPVWTHAAPYEWLATPVDPTSTSEMETFLETWAGVAVDDTSASPVWSAEDAGAPEAWGPGGSSMFLRETYESVRAAKLPRVCLPTSKESYQCIFYDAEAEAVDVHFTGGA